MFQAALVSTELSGSFIITWNIFELDLPSLWINFQVSVHSHLLSPVTKATAVVIANRAAIWQESGTAGSVHVGFVIPNISPQVQLTYLSLCEKCSLIHTILFGPLHQRSCACGCNRTVSEKPEWQSWSIHIGAKRSGWPLPGHLFHNNIQSVDGYPSLGSRNVKFPTCSLFSRWLSPPSQMLGSWIHLIK